MQCYGNLSHSLDMKGKEVLMSTHDTTSLLQMKATATDGYAPQTTCDVPYDVICVEQQRKKQPTKTRSRHPSRES